MAQEALLPEVSRAEEIGRLHSEIVGHLWQSLKKAIRIGELLNEQKSSLKHGEFGPWIKANLHFTSRTARNYMALYRERNLIETENVSDLKGAYNLLTQIRRNDRPLEELPESDPVQTLSDPLPANNKPAILNERSESEKAFFKYHNVFLGIRENPPMNGLPFWVWHRAIGGQWDGWGWEAGPPGTHVKGEIKEPRDCELCSKTVERCFVLQREGELCCWDCYMDLCIEAHSKYAVIPGKGIYGINVKEKVLRFNMGKVERSLKKKLKFEDMHKLIDRLLDPPQMPENWDYEESTKELTKIMAKLKTVHKELTSELVAARGLLNDAEFKEYCVAIGLQ